ncbi:GTPase Era, mitochondrial [Centropristis striata]|uniref:GTPase Era, mitochondrial n=1 Tax=Centropristis striata TaxID=184440 RepID=UPI0027DEFB75|nr:GTPase Era, mitochondrial [Centropristis striata]
MALRLCARLVRDSSVLSRPVAGAARQESASWILTAGNAACSRGGRNGFIFTPACFITSHTLLNRLTKGNPLEENSSSYRFPASVPSDIVEQVSLLMRHPDQPENPKVLKVAVMGAPNAGKSTLSNQILGRKVFAVSKKVHTTRCRALGVLTEDDTQIILLDTPGFTTAAKVTRHQLENTLLEDPWNTVKEADLIVVLVDASDRWMCGRLDPEVLKCLTQHSDTPAILVLNKVDRVKAKQRLLDVTAVLTCGVVNGHRLQCRPKIKSGWGQRPKRDSESSHDEDEVNADSSADPNSELSKDQRRRQLGWAHFKDVFMINSLDREDAQTLKSYFMVAAKPGSWQYHSEVLTDQSPEVVCTNLIREKLLEYLQQEVPYSMTQSIELWQHGENDDLDISVKIYTKKDAHVGIVIGAGGQRVTRIAQEVGEELSCLFLKDVKLRLAVKFRK